MNKLESLLQEIKTSVFLFEEIARLKPSKEKASKLLTIYSMVASQIKEATKLISLHEQTVSQKHITLVKLLNKNLPKDSDLRALFIALKGSVSLKFLLRLDEHTVNSIYVLLDQEAIDTIQNVDAENFGPRQDFSLSINKVIVEKKEKQLLKKLGEIVLALQMTVDPKEKPQVSLEDLQHRKKK